MKTHVKILAVLVVLLALVTAIVAAGFYLSKTMYVRIDGTRYDRSAMYLDLRGQDISLEHYTQLKRKLPRCEIHWDVPFQGKRYDDETTAIQVESLTMEEVEYLDLLPKLQKVDAENCRDLDALLALRQRRPDCTVTLSVYLGDMQIKEHTESLLLNPGEATAQDLRYILPSLKDLKKIHFEDPDIPGMELRALREEFPEISFTWTKPVMGRTYSADIKEIDLSNQKPDSLEQVEALMAYYPELTKLRMENCGFSNDEMAAFRDRVRDQYKVVWGVWVGQAYVMTDQQGFIPSNTNKRVKNDEAINLKYCEGLIAVDFGHTGVHNLEWVVGTPHLKYQIVGDGDVRNEDIAHLTCLKELEYLEVFMSLITDASPLAEIKTLKDLNLSGNKGLDVTTVAEMSWLDNLWLQNTPLRAGNLELLQEKMPNTRIVYGKYKTCHGRGWRQMQSYYDMRDILGMWYISE